MFALPADTHRVFSPDTRDYMNLGLLLDKFAPWELVGEKWDITMRVRERRRGQEEIVPHRGGGAKSVWLREKAKGDEEDSILHPNAHLDGELFKHTVVRWKELIKSLGAKSFEAKVDYRLVVGFGAEHVLETNLCLHRIYGFPIIPGSAVKGVTRAWAMLEESLTETDELFRRMFGTTERQGQVIFFDAYPTQVPKLELDILNPHYMPYYSDSRKQTPPAD